MATERIENLIKSVNNRLQPLLEFDGFYAALHDADSSMLQFPWGIRDGRPIEWDARPYQPLSWLPDSIIRTKTSRLLEQDVEQALKHGDLEYWPKGDLPQSWLAVPMITGDRAIGVIVVENRLKPNAFGENALRVLSSAARQAAQAIEATRLYSNLEERTQELEILTQQLRKRTDQLAALQEIGIKITSQLELEDVLSSIVEHANGLLSADFTTLFSYDAARGEFEKGIRKGKYAVEPSIPSNSGFAARIVKSGQPVYVEDVTQAPDIKPAFIESTQTRSSAGAPLMIGGKAVGLLFVNFAESHTFVEQEREILALLANQAAVAIANAFTLEQLRKEQIKNLAAGRLAMVNAVAGGFVHRMNNVAGTIPVRVAQIQEVLGPVEQTDSRIVRYLTAIQQDAEGILKTAQVIAAQTAKAEPLELVDLRILISTAIQRIATPASIQIVDQCDMPLPKALVFSGQLVDTLENLIRNGIEAIDGSGTVTICATTETLEQQMWLVMTVEDTGRGIPADEVPKIWDLFYTTKENGIGFGLWRAKTLIQSLGGTITATSGPGKGTQFTIRLPAAEEEQR